MLDANKIIAKANTIHAEMKGKREASHEYTPPEQLPAIRSDQEKALVKAIVDAVNKELGNE